MQTNKLYINGIFVQRVEKRFKEFTGFCVTFPRLGNIDKALENEVIFPSETFKTFNQAYQYALKMRNQISVLKACPIVSHCDFDHDSLTRSSYKMKSRVIA
jgi:hypothetical protein